MFEFDLLKLEWMLALAVELNQDHPGLCEREELHRALDQALNQAAPASYYERFIGEWGDR